MAKRREDELSEDETAFVAEFRKAAERFLETAKNATERGLILNKSNLDQATVDIQNAVTLAVRAITG